MISFTVLMSLVSVVAGLVGSATAALTGKHGSKPGQCGKVDVFFTGLPAYHPLVIAQGYDPAVVDAALKADKANILKAGYNLRTILIGPEQPESIVANEMKGIEWEASVAGFGVRGSPSLNMTIHFEELLQTFRERAPQSFFVFNYSPDSTLEALQRRAPIEGDCSEKPGTDLGTKQYCNICAP